MNAANLSLLNAILLIALGLAGYFTGGSPTALIPVGFGAALLACNPGLRRENKAIAHVAVLLTLVILVALAMPLRSAINRGDNPAIGRIVIMLLSTALAMVFMIKSFVDARRSRTADLPAETVD